VFVLNYPRQAKAGEQFVIAQAQDAGIGFLDALGAVIKSRCDPKSFNVRGSPAAYRYFHFGTPD
jgi:hypothetical protein